jgi:hypothetical protein
MFFSKTPSIEEDKIVEEWSQLVLGIGGKGEELLKSISGKLQELNLPNITFARKEATLGKAEPFRGNKREFISMKHDRYRDYELWIGAIDRAGQLKVAWYLTVELPGKILGKIRALDRHSKDITPSVLRAPNILAKKLGQMAAQKLTEKLTGKPAGLRNVHPEDMTMDDKEELGAYITTAHNVVLVALEELMNDLNLDFSKVDKHTEGFLNLS